MPAGTITAVMDSGSNIDDPASDPAFSGMNFAEAYAAGLGLHRCSLGQRRNPDIGACGGGGACEGIACREGSGRICVGGHLGSDEWGKSFMSYLTTQSSGRRPPAAYGRRTRAKSVWSIHRADRPRRRHVPCPWS